MGRITQAFKRPGRTKFIAAVTVPLSITLLLIGASSDAANKAAASNAAAGRMMSSRAGSCATVLKDGRLLITGGEAGKSILASTELFSVRSGASGAPSMSSARSEHACAVLSDGRVLVAGGWTTGGTVLNTIEILDSALGAWTPAGILTSPRAGATASLLKNGKVLIAGGETPGGVLGSVELYDPATGNVESAPLPLLARRSQHAAAVLGNGKVLIAGGTDGTNALDTLELYDPATGVFSAAGKLSQRRSGLTATVLLEGKVYFAGGSDGARELNTAEIYNPNDGSLTPAAQMGAPRTNHLAFRLPQNNAVLIVGGKGNGQMMAGAELYIPWWNKYKPLASVKIAQATGSGVHVAALIKAALSETVINAATSDPSLFPVLSTDKDDYSPGETATITGTGWPAGSTVSLHLDRNPNHAGLAPKDWTVIVPAKNADGTDNTDGAFTTTYDVVEDDLNETFTLTGYVSGTMETAQIMRTVTFTDSRMLNSVTLSSTTVAPGATISATVSVTTTENGANTRWRSTGWSIGTAPATMNCVNHPNHDANGTFLETFSITAPATPGSYNAYFTAYNDDGCGNGASNTVILANVVVKAPPQSQTITFPQPTSPVSYQGTFTVNPTSDSGLPVSVAAFGVCSISGTTVTMSSGAGTCTLTASQPGNDSFNAAADVIRTVSAQKATATIALSGLTGQAYTGSPIPVTAATTPAGLPGLSIRYDGNATAPVNAGSYAVVASLSNDNYQAVNATGTLVIGKAAATIALSGLTGQTYTGSPIPVTAATTPVGLQGLSITYDGNATAPVNAGSYAVAASLSNDNYQAVNATGTLVIGKAPATVTLGSLTHVYNTSPQSATATTNPIGLPVAFTYAVGGQSVASPVNAGSYVVTATITDINHQGSTSGTLVITPASATVTVTDPNVLWTGAAQSALINTGGLSYTTKYKGAGETTYAESETQPKDPGTYSVAVTVTDPNYFGSTGSGALTINNTDVGANSVVNPLYNFVTSSASPAARVTFASASTKGITSIKTVPAPYPVDTTKYKLASSPAYYEFATTATFTGNVQVCLVYAAGTFTKSDNLVLLHFNSGNTEWQATGSTVDQANNRVCAVVSAFAVFTLAEDTATTTTLSVDNSNPTYGTQITLKATISPADATGAVQFFDNGNALGAPVSVSSGQAQLQTSALTGGMHSVTATYVPASYYGGSTSAAVTVEVAKAIATLSLGNLNQTYDGSARPVIVTSLPADLSGVSVTYNGSATAPTNAGSYSVTASLVNDNYQAANATGTLVIEKATAPITLGGLTQTYDGTAKSATATTTPTNLNVTFTYTQNNQPAIPLAAGSYAVAATINDANYQGSKTGMLVIEKATAPITLGGLMQTYDGSVKAATAMTTPANLNVTFAYTQNNQPATALAAGSYQVTATINDANYQGSKTGTLVIEKATATVVLSGLSQTYDGSVKAASATPNPTGVAVTLAYTQGGAAATPKNAGSYQVTATVNDPNYDGTATGVLVIGKGTATVTLTATTLSHTYDSTPKSAAASTSATGTSTFTFTYNGSAIAPTNAGSYAVVATLVNDNYQGSATGTMNIAKAPATLTLTQASLTQIYDGSQKTVTATTTPAGLSGISVTYAGSATAPANPGTYAVIVSLTNGNYMAANASGTLTIVNVNPVVTLTGPASGSVYAAGTPITFTGNFTDVGVKTHTATFAFDSTTSSSGIVTEATGAVTLTRSLAPGVYKVTLTVKDNFGGTGAVSQIGGMDLLVVVYDPNAGFVTGGGWIASSAGACQSTLMIGGTTVCSQDAAGKANFGFVSKYLKGAQKPTGETEFQFKAGNLNFSSTSYDVLVISGPMAQYRGFGTINGQAGYKFILTARDGKLPGGGGVDGFRMKITDSAGTTTIYDNLNGLADSTQTTNVQALTQPTGNGSVSIKSN
jgi:hypothetical protein